MKITILLIFLVLISCRSRLTVENIDKHFVDYYHKVNLVDNPIDSISVYYTGCGGFLIKEGNAAVFLDPYFSNVTGLLLVPCKKLKTNSTAIDTFFTRVFANKKDKEGIIKGILLAHSHYDHLADVPHIYKTNCAESTNIYGGNTSKFLLKDYGTSSISFKNQTDLKKNNCLDEDNEEGFIWILKNKIRVLPIVAEHAPHLAGKKFLPSDTLIAPRGKKPKRAPHLPEGENYNYLIDFLDENKNVKFRIFSNTGSACNANVGFPPKHLMEKDSVDLLLMCVASYSQVAGYPNGLINFINPRYILFNHWENFFRPFGKLNPKRPKTVPFTRMDRFIDTLEKNTEIESKYKFPMPLTEVKITF